MVFTPLLACLPLMLGSARTILFSPIGTISDDDAYVAVEAAGGQRYRFLIDSGFSQSAISPRLAKSSVPLAIKLLNGQKIEFQAIPDDEAKDLDGYLGMDVLKRMQLKLDPVRGVVSARLDSTPLTVAQASFELSRAGSYRKALTFPLAQMDDEGMAVQCTVDGKSVMLELDTGSNIVCLPEGVRKDISATSLGSLGVLQTTGASKLPRYLARRMSIGQVSLLWPAFYRSDAEAQKTPHGFVGSFALTQGPMIIDFRGKKLFMLPPTPEDQLNLALSSFLDYYVTVGQGSIRFVEHGHGKPFEARVVRFASHPAEELLRDMLALQRGDEKAWDRLVKLQNEWIKQPRLRLVTSSGEEISTLAATPEFSVSSKPSKAGATPTSPPPGPAEHGWHWRWTPGTGWIQVKD